MQDLKFTTHMGETVTGDRLNSAINQVADDMVRMYKGIRNGYYAPHVTEAQKDYILLKDLLYVDQIRAGEGLNNFTIWQRINNVLTGECVALLS